MTVKKRLSILVFSALFGLITICAIGIYQLARVFTAANFGNENTVPALVALGKVSEGVGSVRISVYRHIFLGSDDKAIAEADKRLEDATNLAKSGLSLYEPTIVDTEDRRRFDNVKNLFGAYLAELGPILDLSRKQNKTGAQERLAQLAGKGQQLTHAVDEYIDYNVQLGNKATAEAKNIEITAFYLFAGITLATLIFLALAGRKTLNALMEQLGGEPSLAMEIAGRVANNDLEFVIDTQSGDTSSVIARLKHMQESLRERLAAERKIASESLRVKIALDNVSTGVMIADTQRNIVYVNKSAQQILKAAESDIRTQLPAFTADDLVGKNIDIFHKIPSHQAQLLGTLSKTYVANLQIGNRHMTVTANPVIDAGGERVGSVAEWKDRTTEVRIEQEIQEIVSAASRGNLALRIEQNGKVGFFALLATAVNQLLESTQCALKSTSAVLGLVSQGDLTRTVEDDFEGVFGQLKEDTNSTVIQLQEVIGSILAASDAINTAAKEIAAGNADLSRRTEEQASSLEETASSMEQLNSTVKQNAQNAIAANQLTQQSYEAIENGGKAVNDVVHTMAEIQSSSTRIGDIISVIDGIAFQTNILALNAAVEAARAGEQGRGFAVVATEVRSLAQRSAAAAKEIKELINESVSKVDAGAQLVQEAGSSMEKVVESFRVVAGLVSQISEASNEQSSGITQVAQAVSQMDEVTQQNAALVEQAAAAAESLESQADELQRVVSRFKIEAKTNLLSATHHRTATAKTSRNVGSDDAWSEF